jgi:hypothetical protein
MKLDLLKVKFDGDRKCFKVTPCLGSNSEVMPFM